VSFLLILLVVAAVAAIVMTPFVRGSRSGGRTQAQARRADLEAARDAKYAEIRDAELDRRTGKLDDDDYRAIDRQLRAEAIEILRAIDELNLEDPAPEQ
jgi:hypothetical protein